MATKKLQPNSKVKGENVIPAIISAPRVTEKATMHMEKNVYVFNVSPRATKSELMKAIKSIYKITPEKINVVTIPAKKVFVRGKKGTKSGGKKALIFLKKGEKIEIS